MHETKGHSVLRDSCEITEEQLKRPTDFFRTRYPVFAGKKSDTPEKGFYHIFQLTTGIFQSSYLRWTFFFEKWRCPECLFTLKVFISTQHITRIPQANDFQRWFHIPLLQDPSTFSSFTP